MDWTSMTLNLVQAIAILVGGTWVYFKFIRSRTFARRAELDVQAAIYEVTNGLMIKAHVNLKNAGLSKLPLREGLQIAKLSGTLTDEWTAGANLIWHDLMQSRIFTQHQWVEAQETIEDEVLLPVERGQEEWLAFRVTVVVTGIRSIFRKLDPAWNASTIFLAPSGGAVHLDIPMKEGTGDVT
jgi:hypothetical protein